MFNYSYKGPFQKEANLLNPLHFDLKGSRSQAKINENFANYFLKTKANYKCFIVLKCMLRATENYKSVRAEKSIKPKALLHFKVDPALTIDETSHICAI